MHRFLLRRQWPWIVVGCAVVAGLAQQFACLSDRDWQPLSEIGWPHLVVALGITVAYRIVNAWGWSLALDAVGTPIGSTVAVRIWLQSEACRWLPGGVWNLGSRALLATRQGISAVHASASVLLELLLTLAAWAIVAIAGAMASGGALTERLHEFFVASNTAAVAGLAALALLLAGLFILGGPVRRRLTQTSERLAALGALRPRAIPCMKALLHYTVLATVNGIAFTHVFWAFAPVSSAPAIGLTGVNAAAWLVGFLAFGAPGGIVVRETCLAGMLSTWIPLATALQIAVLWRLVQLLAEAICLAGIVGLSYAARGNSKTPLVGEMPSAPKSCPGEAAL